LRYACRLTGTSPRQSQAYARGVLKLGQVDLDEIAQALSDQTDYEHQWMLDPATGELHIWTSDTGLDGQDLMDDDELEDTDLIAIDPLPSPVWYADMADFAERISDEHASRRLARAIRGRGAFRHFKDELYEEYPDLVSVWHTFRDVRARRRAVEWLLDEGLIDATEAAHYLKGHPDPALP
jgi:hypothetical protein